MRTDRVVAALALALLAACGDGTGPVPGGSSINVAGRVWTLDGASPQGLRFSVRSAAGTSSAAVGADGTFQLSATVAGDTVDFIIDAPPGTANYHPALVRGIGGATPDLRFVVIPKRWTIAQGAFAGTTADISPDAAFRPPCTNTSDTNCDGFYPRAWLTGMKLWPATSFPIRLAIDHPRSHQTITAQDSAALWLIVDRMNADFGTTLFRPARIEEISVSGDGRPDRAVLIRVDTTLTGFGAWTNWWWDGNGDMYAGVIRPARRDRVLSGSLMTHELLHTQGFKHSCSWQTVMGGYGCSSFTGLSTSDVAHAHVAIAARARQQQTGATHGLIAAMNGQRDAAGLPLFEAPALPRLVPFGMDGIGEPVGDHAHH